MPEKPFTPPTRKPVSEFPTPSHAVAFYTELVNRDDPAYYQNAPVKRGSRYSTMVGAKRDVMEMYPDLFFLQEQKYQLNDQLVLWHWATDENAHDTYNADVTYVANAVTYPAFTRVYTIRREIYEAQPVLRIGSPLPGIIAVEITSPGQNHTAASGIIDGTSAEIDFVVDSNGSLVSAVITNTGDELIQDRTSITIIGDGQDSAAIARTQPVGCVLTAQKKEELPQDDPTQHELVRVTRTYETLPGPWIYTYRFDVDGALITSKIRRQVSDFITDSDEIIPNGTDSDWVQTWHKEIDDFVSEETVESRKVPGNLIFDTKIADDGKVITTDKILIDVSTAVNDETLVGGVWTKRFLQQVDDSTLIKVHQASNKVSWQMFESRDIPGNPMETTRIDNDGVVIHVTTTLSEASTIVDGETLVGGVWTKVTAEAVSDLVAKKIVETRTIPGNPMPTSRIDEDSVPVSIVTTYKDKTLVTTSEAINAGVWTKTKEEHCTSDMGVSDLVVDEVVESRTLPGLPMVSIKIDKDGKPKDVIKTLKDTLTITPSEALQVILGVNYWITTEKEAVSDLVAWEVVSARDANGNVVSSANIGSDLHVANIETKLRPEADITPSSDEAGGFITTFEKKDVTDLVSEQIRTVRKWVDEAFYSISVINLIPREFMATIPTKVVSHILPGTASQTAIGFQEFEHSQKQLNKLFYEERITTIDAPSLPITHSDQETTEVYGGGVINLTYTLAILGSIGIDQGLLVVDSKLTDLGNGMVVKETRELPESQWPPLQGTDLDEVHLVALPYEKQTVAAGTTGGIVGSVYTQVRPIDVWRSDSIATTVPSDLSSLNRDYATVVNHAFPDTLIDATLDIATASANGAQDVDFGLSYTLLRGYRGACDGHIYEVYTNGPPSGLPTVTKFFPQSAMRTVAFATACASSSEDCSGRLFARVWEFEFPMSLHDLIVVENTGYTMTIPATTPTALPASGTEITVDIQTERWKYGIYITKIINVIMP